MSEPIRVELDGALAGRHVLVDPKKLTAGALEDMQDNNVGMILDGLSRVLVGGDLPQGTDRAGLRELVSEELFAVLKGVGTCIRVPKR